LLDNFPIKGCDWQIHAIAEADGQVLTERTDRFLLASGAWAELPVMGIFAFNAAGRISLWRDYFDIGQFQSEFAK
jgi:limonene-1,2-epoxide hydrolase